MADLRLFANTSNLIRFVLKHATTGQGLPGLTSASAGLIISTIADNEATATAYTQAGSTIEGITTLGTFATPTATKCRFKEVDATNHKGLYEFQFADARFAVASSKRLVISVTGATNLLDTDYEIQLVQFNPYDAVRLGLTALPNAAAEAAGGLFTRGTGAGQINQAANGMIDTNPVRLNNVSQSLLDLKDFADDGYDPSTNKVQGVVLTDTVTTVTSGVTVTTNNDKTGYALSGTQTFNVTGNITGNLSGSVGSVTGAVGSVTGGVTVTTNNDKTGYSLSSAGIQAIWDALTSALTTVGSIGKLLVDNVNATISSRSSHSAADVWAVVTRVLTAGTNIVLAKGTGITGFNDLDAGGIRGAVGLASANLDTQLDALPTAAEIRAEIDSNSTQLAKLGTISNLGSGATIGANLVDIEGQTDDLESRLTATRAGYLDNLSAGAVALQASVDDLEGRLTAARAGYLDNLNVGGNVASAASIAALNNLSAAQVNAEIVDALNVDTYAEPGQEAPPATTTLVKKIGYLYKAFRNPKTQTATTLSMYNDAGTVVDQKATISDDGTTYTHGKIGTGP